MNMKTQEIYRLMNENPVFHLATIEENQPRVRGMLLFGADENGIVFHTAQTKGVYKQIKQNSSVELCFQANGTQIRVCGRLEESDDEQLRDEIFSHPSRAFLQIWKEKGIAPLLKVFILKTGKATVWTMETNFNDKEFITIP
jgi:uncharacterized pyridoxamine 5'-phosphate oxidase family protein